MLIDLQLHSTYSDGYLTPTELVEFISKKGVKVASLTDHNTVGGLEEFRNACARHKIKAVTGLEFYVKHHNHRFNLLWYNFREDSPELHKILRDSQTRRRRQVRRMLEKLVRRGFIIDINNVLDKYNKYVPINHIIDDIKSNRHNFARMKDVCECKNPTEGEIIKELFRNKKIGVLRESYISLKRILEHKKEIGGLLILNHPAKHGHINIDFWKKLKKLGIDGVELLSPHHGWGAIVYIQHLARKFNFIETGGSDFHRYEGDRYLLQKSWDYFKIDSKYLKGVSKIIK